MATYIIINEKKIAKGKQTIEWCVIFSLENRIFNAKYVSLMIISEASYKKQISGVGSPLNLRKEILWKDWPYKSYFLGEINETRNFYAPANACNLWTLNEYTVHIA